jgi:hypothetical protein
MYNTMQTTLYLGNNSILGNGAANASPNNAQISLHSNYAALTAPVNVMILSDSTAANDGNSAAGCTAITNNGNVSATCPAVLSIPHGDISVPNGEVLAQKVYSTSDARLKTDIRKLKNPLEDLMKIDAVSYTLKSSGGKGMGVTAQNLEKVYPELVSTNNGNKYVEYNGLMGPLIGAIQQLKQDNDALRVQLKQQQDEIRKLQKTAP